MLFDESGLIDELLLALVGIHGDTFVDPDDARAPTERDDDQWQLPGPGSCSVYLSADLTWVSQPDREVLSELLRLGFHFKCLSVFVEWEVAPWATEEWTSRTRPPSIYRRALASGLTEVLDDYRVAVLELQAELRAAEVPALPTILHRMWEYTEVLPALHALAAIHDKRGPSFSSADLINSLASQSRSCGSPSLGHCLTRLLWHCNQVMLQQLAAW
ncbi:hypothetical protein GPECTOR_25g307 [Gonium pectorale]|uniref:Gamma-tubulin complex component n=1 Tax=Gonium pectorale TaxID=33097 RepID=A0A150GFX8_GONPE|nr:hypothetical protein GPECTOR_25g307 [Gonium pectorale]|eukprot:KXZ48724.1 hypothetical protein GPECTOR_25g307 [Gonium pectorale]